MSNPIACWQQALAAEQAAVAGYGALGPHVAPGAQASLARDFEQAHRVQAQAATAELQALGAAPGATLATYELPYAMTDASSAQRLAVALEDSTAQAWRYVLVVLCAGAPDDAVAARRQLAVSALSDAAVRAVQWRRLQGLPQPSATFPGI